MNKVDDVYNILNSLWKFIKKHPIPTQNENDNPAWEKIVEDSTKLCEDYQSKAPLDVLFRSWVVDYLDYMSDVSKGRPTLTQEADTVAKEVLKDGK